MRVVTNLYVYLGRDTTLFDNQSITLDAGSGFDSFLWSNNKTSQKITIDTNGIGLATKLFWVKVKQNSCEGYDSVNITFVEFKSVMNTEFGFNIRVFPNPARDMIFIKVDKQPENMTLILKDLNGKCLVLKENISFKDNVSSQIDVSEFPAGIYFVNLINHENSVVVKILKY
jgi:hypothetical protein